MLEILLIIFIAINTWSLYRIAKILEDIRQGNCNPPKGTDDNLKRNYW